MSLIASQRRCWEAMGRKRPPAHAGTANRRFTGILGGKNNGGPPVEVPASPCRARERPPSGFTIKPDRIPTLPLLPSAPVRLSVRVGNSRTGNLRLPGDWPAVAVGYCSRCSRTGPDLNAEPIISPRPRVNPSVRPLRSPGPIMSAMIPLSRTALILYSRNGSIRRDHPNPVA